MIEFLDLHEMFLNQHQPFFVYVEGTFECFQYK